MHFFLKKNRNFYKADNIRQYSGHFSKYDRCLLPRHNKTSKATFEILRLELVKFETFMSHVISMFIMFMNVKANKNAVDNQKESIKTK